MSVARNIRLLRAIAPRGSRSLLSTEAGSGEGPKAAAPPPQPPPPVKPTTSSASSVSTDNTKYQCGIYYEHNEWSYYDIENAMMSKRVGQPSSKKTQP